jgi:hypothetical protein
MAKLFTVLFIILLSLVLNANFRNKKNGHNSYLEMDMKVRLAEEKENIQNSSNTNTNIDANESSTVTSCSESESNCVPQPEWTKNDRSH